MSRPDGSVTYPSYPGRANFSQWRIQGRAPLLLDQTETRKAEKCFLDPPPTPPPLSQGLSDRAPPFSEGLDPPLSPTFPYKTWRTVCLRNKKWT